jgi:hypothetical protein
MYLWIKCYAAFIGIEEGEGLGMYVVCAKSFRTYEIALQLDVLAMSGKLRCLVVCFLIIILFAMSSCCD